jgi:hypothetical protein
MWSWIHKSVYVFAHSQVALPTTRQRQHPPWAEMGIHFRRSSGLSIMVFLYLFFSATIGYLTNNSWPYDYHLGSTLTQWCHQFRWTPPRYRLFIFGSVFLFTDTWRFCISVPLRLGYCTHFESWTWGGEGTLNVNIWHIESHVNGAWRRHLKGDRDAVCRTYKHVFPWLTLPQPFPLDNVTDLTEPFLPTRTVLMKGGGTTVQMSATRAKFMDWTSGVAHATVYSGDGGFYVPALENRNTKIMKTSVCCFSG